MRFMTPGPSIGALFLVAGLAACDPTGPALRIVTETLPSGREAVAYSAGINAEGGDGGYDWEVVQGRLPPGLSLSTEDLSADEDVLITGAPSQTGTFTFTMQARDAEGATVTKEFTLEILAPLVRIDNLVLPPALRGYPYDVRLRGTGGLEPRSFAITGGTLPQGLALVDGDIQGTPTETDTVSLEVQVTSGDEVDTRTFELMVLAEQPDRYNITTVHVTPVPGGIRSQLQTAIELWEAALTGDLAVTEIPTTFFRAGQCGGFGQSVNGTHVDDIIIIVNIAPIDGPGQILGQAGPCASRDSASGALPVAGILTLDSEDLSGTGGVHVLAHEIGHVLGFGSYPWTRFGLLEGSGDGDPRFNGAGAVEEWQQLGGSGLVPVEGTGGAGTADSHWRESTFGNELMTGFLSNAADQPLSRMSIASMADIGYVVNLDAAQPYSLTSIALREGQPPSIKGYDVVLREPIRTLESRRDGTGNQPKIGGRR